jgi:CHAT domain-containing protein
MRRHDFLGVSDALIRAGLPAALGLRWPVQDDSARLLAETFYKTLFVPDLPGLAQALFIARSELASRDRKDPTWLSPILVSHLE